MKKIWIIIAIAIFAIAIFLFPRQIYDEFLWKYFIGPVIADAVGHPVEYNGIVAKEGYTIISEIFYAIFLLSSIYILYKFFEKFDITVDNRFFLSTLPMILLGSFGRVLEDADILKPPLSYFFISPLIYFQISIYFSLAILFGIFIKKDKYYIISVAIIDFLYAMFYLFFRYLFRFILHPLIFVLISLISIYIYILHERKDYNASLLSYGFLFFIPSFLIFLSLPLKMSLHINGIIFISPLLSLITASAIWIVSKYVGSIFHEFINTSLIFSHSLDAFTTWMVVANPFSLGISYGEKHPISSILLKYGIAYPLIKIFVIMLIIYGVNDLKKNLKNIIKWLVLFLGLAPGLRDFLRVLIGV